MAPPAAAELDRCGDFTDEELNSLHAVPSSTSRSPFPGGSGCVGASLCWVTARSGEQPAGFVNVIRDGDAHAVLLDTCAAPALQGGTSAAAR